MNALPSLIDTNYQQRDYHRKKPRWYHSHIIDWMMAHPNGKLDDCAKHVGKSPATLSAIIRSDMFQAALTHRKKQFAALADAQISGKLNQVALASLDVMLDVINTKKNNIPLETLNTVADGALKRLGYGVQQTSPAVQVNVQQNAAVPTPVSAEDLNAARALMKQNQERLASDAAKVVEVIEPQKGAVLVNGPKEGE